MARPGKPRISIFFFLGPKNARKKEKKERNARKLGIRFWGKPERVVGRPIPHMTDPTSSAKSSWITFSQLPTPLRNRGHLFSFFWLIPNLFEDSVFGTFGQGQFQLRGVSFGIIFFSFKKVKSERGWGQPTPPVPFRWTHFFGVHFFFCPSFFWVLCP